MDYGADSRESTITDGFRRYEVGYFKAPVNALPISILLRALCLLMAEMAFDNPISAANVNIVRFMLYSFRPGRRRRFSTP